MKKRTFFTLRLINEPHIFHLTPGEMGSFEYENGYQLPLCESSVTEECLYLELQRGKLILCYISIQNGAYSQCQFLPAKIANDLGFVWERISLHIENTARQPSRYLNYINYCL